MAADDRLQSEVLECLTRVLASKEFRNSPRLSQFLRYVVEETLGGRQDQVKESAIGVAVFQREPTYDPKTDSLVRTQAVELRLRLARYYETNGTDAWAIRLPKGSYVPKFEKPTPAKLLRPKTPLQLSKRYVWVAAAIGSTLIAGFLLWIRFKPAVQPRRLTRVTSNVGRSVTPALSRSGEMIAYASDRTGRGDFDLYVQAVRGADALRLTTDPANDFLPSFSPDGSRIAFLRMRGKTWSPGEVFVVPVVGGQERLVAAEAGEPRFSPDGAWISFTRLSPNAARPARAFIVRPDGTGEREICPEFSVVGNPIWTPDGRHLLFGGREKPSTDPRHDIDDWWVTPANSCRPVRTGAIVALRAMSKGGGIPGIAAIRYWHEDGVIFSYLGIFHLPISQTNWQVTGPPKKIPLGLNPSVYSSHAAGRIAFEDQQTQYGIFELPLESESAAITGPLRPIVEDLDYTGWPSISRDGQVLEYGKGYVETNTTEFRIRQLPHSDELTLPFPGEKKAVNQSLSPDGKSIFFHRGSHGLHKPCDSLHRIDIFGKSEVLLCKECRFAWATTDGKSLLLSQGGSESGKIDIELLDLGSSIRTTVLSKPGRFFLTPALSADEKWATFSDCSAELLSTHCRIRVAPWRNGKLGPESSWVTLTGEGPNRVPLWSPQGNAVYYYTEDNGERYIRAQRLSEETKKPIGHVIDIIKGEAIAPRSFLPMGVDHRGYGLARDKIVVSLTERRSTIWLVE